MPVFRVGGQSLPTHSDVDRRVGGPLVIIVHLLCYNILPNIFAHKLYFCRYFLTNYCIANQLNLTLGPTTLYRLIPV